MTRSNVQLGGQELKLDADGDTSIQVSSDDVLIVDTAGNEALKIDANGHVTKPLQSAFLANPAAAGASPVQNNISSGDTITFGTEIFDQNGDFASNTFTAPVTGKYQLNLGLFLESVDTGYTELRIKIVTSNRNYDSFQVPSQQIAADCNLQYQISSLADMDANDTALIQVTFNSGAAQMDVNALSFFSGYLVA